MKKMKYQMVVKNDTSNKMWNIMSNLVFVSYEDGDPPLSSFIDEKSLLSFVNNLLTHLHYYDWELSILFSRDPFIQNLNKTYRNIDAPTDVLSFEMGECYEDENGYVYCEDRYGNRY